MNLYLSKTHSDEDGPYAEEGKLGIIYSDKEDLIKLCEFFEKIKATLNTNDTTLHMQFRDFYKEWDSNTHIDIEVNLKNN